MRRPRRPLRALLAVSAVALVARLWALGWRVMHQDESRVADWILQYSSAGWWDYYPMIHGPFLPHVNSVVFGAIGPSDFSARLIVALLGGLLPLSAWLFRDHLRDGEVVGLGVLLALNPLLLYYSRFMRNDVPTAAFMLIAVGLFLRAYDTGRVRYLYAGAVSFTLAFTAKELALLYPFYWLGAAALLLDHRLALAAARGDGLRSRLPRWLDDAVGGAAARLRDLRARALAAGAAVRGRGDPVAALRTGDATLVADRRRFAVTGAAALVVGLGALVALPPVYAPLVALLLVLGVAVWGYAPRGRHLVGASALAFAVFVFFYAPREPIPESPGAPGDPYLGADPGPGLFEALENPLLLPELIEEATYGVWLEFLSRWGASASGHSYVGYLDAFWTDVETGALALFVLAIAGLLVDRYTGDGPRDVVAFAGYWGFAAFVTFPIIAENAFPWEMVHVVVPLAIPAAVALAWLYRRLTSAVVERDLATAMTAALFLLLAVGQMGVVAYDTSYARPQSPDVATVQYAQPAGEMQPTLREIYSLSEGHDGTDVLYYGSEFHRPPDAEWGQYAPEGWFGRLPFPWYFGTNGVTADSTTEAAAVLADPPPVVVTMGNPGEGCWNRGDFEQDARDLRTDLRAQGYREVTHQQYLYCRPVVVFLRS